MRCGQSDHDYIAENGWHRSDLMDRAELPEILRKLTGYYVYVIWARVDQQTTPFYVGLGKGRRVLRHTLPSERANNRVKRGLWSRCLKAGGSILYSLAATDLSRDDACLVERGLIEKIGRLIFGTGPLSNLTDGGDGSISISHRKAGQSPKAKRIVADGRPFPSIHEAAAALKTGKGTIMHRVRNGWPGYHYPDGPAYPCRKGRLSGAESPRARAVIADGQRYETLSSAASALGCHPPAILRRITRGWLGYYYESEGQRQTAKRRLRQSRVEAEGRVYESVPAAAKALGVHPETVRGRLNRQWTGYSRLGSDVRENVRHKR